jgi:DNA processing protein
MFGLKEAEVATLVRAVAGDDLDREAIADRFARGAWTGIAEPGDGAAGIVVAALGAAEALEGLVAHWTGDQWHAALLETGNQELSRSDVDSALGRWNPRISSAPALLAFRQAARFGASLLVPDSAGWPSGVDDLGVHAPLALWMRGVPHVLAAWDRSIAVVGARAATGYGEHVTIELAAGLADRGYAVISGAAYGIDGAAHRAALASRGATVAFLAGGVDRFYPSGHDTLLTRIVEAGAVISELPCGSPPTKWRFLQRNRLIAASSQATVVVEAGWRSGSLNTAGHAAALGRPVGAIPGPTTSAASAGCHRLIRDYGATLVTSAEQAVELVSFQPELGLPDPEVAASPGTTTPASSARPVAGLSADQTRLMDALSTRAPRASSDIAARSGLSLAHVRSLLGPLELDGVVVERERGWIKMVPKS